MAGGIKETAPDKLAKHCENLMIGAKKLYDESDGDMWFFELYHHLSDCAEYLRIKAAIDRAND